MRFVLDRTEYFLLEILKQEVCQKSISKRLTVTLAELGQIMRLAREHTVQGTVANAVVQGNIGLSVKKGGDKEIAVLELMKVNIMHQRNYLRFENALADLAKLMEQYQIRYVVFKGLAVARHYQVSYTRTMGDVDFYVPASDFSRTVEVIERNLQVKIEKEDIDKHFSFYYQSIRFEMHYQIETFGSTKHQRYFNHLIDRCIDNGLPYFCISGYTSNCRQSNIAVLPPNEDLIVVFKHWFNHLLVEGIGLRQTLDLAVLLKAYRDKLDIAELMIALDRIGYLNAFRAMLAMMKKYFGLSWVDVFCLLNDSDRRYGDKLIATVLESGNFGQKAYKHKAYDNRKSFETAQKALRHCLKFFKLAPWDILCLVPKRIRITLKVKI